tara:strand:+ start:415 stop:1089 length:675 start_codon:yes stop_codon:yes gene_type:complete
VSKKEIFSSKPTQITKAAIQLSLQIFGENERILVGAIGDKDLVFRIAENFNKLENVESQFFRDSKDLFIKNESKLLIDKKNIIKSLFKFDVVLIGFHSAVTLITKELVKFFLKKRKQKPILFVDVGLPGNVDSELLKISNCYLFDLNDLEQFFTKWYNNENKKKINNNDVFNFEEDKYLFDFFKKMKFDEKQKIKFSNHIEDFFFKNNEKNLRSALIKFFKSFI